MKFQKLVEHDSLVSLSYIFTASIVLESIYVTIPFAPCQSKDTIRSRVLILLDDRETGRLIPGIAATIIHLRSY